MLRGLLEHALSCGLLPEQAHSMAAQLAGAGPCAKRVPERAWPVSLYNEGYQGELKLGGSWV